MIMRIGIAALVIALLSSTFHAQSCIADGANMVKISAKRFEFSPHEITVKKGVPVTLQLTTEDRSHGFNIPSLNLRADVVPGKVSELKLTPQKAGELDFFCDIFCGSGHEGMSGKFIVTE